MSIPGDGAAETPSDAEFAEDVAGSPPEEAEDLDGEDAETPSDEDLDEEGDGDETDDQDDDESEEDQEEPESDDPREALLATLTPEQQREFKRLENDSKRLGRFAKQNKILARRLEALEAHVQTGGKKEPEADPRVTAISREMSELVPQIKQAHATWTESYKAHQEASNKLAGLNERLKATPADDDYARTQLESRIVAQEAALRSLEMKCEHEADKFRSKKKRYEELEAKRPDLEREAKDERERQAQERERQARKLAAFPGKVEGMINAAAEAAGIPISKTAEKVRYGHFVDGTKARVANWLVARGQQGKPMATDRQIQLAVKKAVEIEATVIGARRPGRTAAPLATRPVVQRPKQAAPKAGTEEKLSPQEKYNRWKADTARKARALAMNPNSRTSL